MPGSRERWATRVGLVLAMAGNAVGLGNFLRFPVQAARNGGGAFLIPYFIALVLMAIPLMWMEWTIGRRGGRHGHATTPGAFETLWRHPAAKYLGVLGIFIPTVIMIYYTYVESWTLGYAVLHLAGQVPASAGDALGAFRGFNEAYVGRPADGSELVGASALAYGFFVVTLGLNVWILARGVAGGIERLARLALPLLFGMAAVLVVWTFALGRHVGTPAEGLGYLWNPDFTALTDPDVWLAAAGQVFFTLSLGMGAVVCYASYLREDDDVVLSGLATSAANEFAEVVLGGSIAIPAAVTFFGLVVTQQIAESGSYYLGFVSMPAIFSTSAAGAWLGALWFGLLFLAGLTSSVAMAQPLMAFVQEELGLARGRAAALLGVFFFLSTNLCVWLRGALDVMDFWAGTFGPPLLALVQVVLVLWLFGGERFWAEMHDGAELRVPRFFYWVSRWVTPVFLSVILGAWGWQNLLGVDAARGLEGAGSGVGVWTTRWFLVGLFAAMTVAVRVAWRRRKDAS